jgi:hypothetical protein
LLREDELRALLAGTSGLVEPNQASR